MKLEICLDSVASALSAAAGGADRVELCANLLEGGTTPSAGMIAATRRAISIGLHVMIRPRGGDFLYSRDELAVMREDIAFAKSAGAHGVVFGCLRADGTIDEGATAELAKLARPMSVTFHRAFDVCLDAGAALETLTGLGIDRILTSGQAPNVLEGAPRIAELIRAAAGRVIILPGGGITEANLPRIMAETGANEFHMSLSRREDGPMRHRVSNIPMGGALFPNEHDRVATDTSAVARVRAKLR